MKWISHPLTLALMASALPLMAQQPQAGDLGGSYSATISYTADSELKRHHVDYGDFSATLLRANVLAVKTLNDCWSLSVGPVFDYSHFDAPRRAPLPESGYVTSLHVGAVWRINDRWAVRADIRPGLYTDYEDISGGDFNAPFLAAVTWNVDTNLMLVLGIGVNFRSDLGTIGGPGLRWRFADDWTLNLILPRPTIDYALTRDITLFAGGEWRSSSFRVSENFGTKHGNRELNDDDFSYRELRAVGGVRWNLARQLSLELSGGYAFNRRAEFRDADVTFRGGSAPFVQLGVAGSF